MGEILSSKHIPVFCADVRKLESSSHRDDQENKSRMLRQYLICIVSVMPQDVKQLAMCKWTGGVYPRLGLNSILYIEKYKRDMVQFD